MIQTLALLTFALLLLAGAIELWWGSAARQQRRRSLAHIELSLGNAATLPPALAAGMPARRVDKGAASSAAPPQGLPTDALMLRAGLSTGWRTLSLLALIGIMLALLASWRIGSIWCLPWVLGLYVALVWLWLRARIEKKQRQLVHQLPDFLDSMVRLTTLGNSLPMAFQTNVPLTPLPLRDVLDRALRLVRTGRDLDQALEQTVRPYRLQELELLHVVLGAGMRMGGRADQILQRMSTFMRDLAQARQELRAITSETRLSAWVLCLLPVIVAVIMALLNPEFFMPMITQPLGHKLLLAALGLEAFGGLLLYSLARSL